MTLRKKGSPRIWDCQIDDVTKALGQPKGVKRLTDEMWEEEAAGRKAAGPAGQAVADKSVHSKIPEGASICSQSAFRFEGGVFMELWPLEPTAQWLAFPAHVLEILSCKLWKDVPHGGQPRVYEMQVQNLLRKPNYITARRAGVGE